MSKNVNVEREFDSRAAQYSEKSSWAANEDILRDCAALLGRRQFRTMLDLGGGTGLLGDFLRKELTIKRIVVVDQSQKMLDHVPAGIETVRANIEHGISLPWNDIDLITMRQVMHYLESPVDTLRQIAQRLSSSTIIYIGQIIAPTQDTATALMKFLNEMDTSRRRIFSFGSLYSEIYDAGLSIEKIGLTPFFDNFTDWKTRGLSNRKPETFEGILSGTPSSRELELHKIGDVEFFRNWFCHVLARLDKGSQP